VARPSILVNVDIDIDLYFDFEGTAEFTNLKAEQ
jgi:hypothetical protein